MSVDEGEADLALRRIEVRKGPVTDIGSADRLGDVKLPIENRLASGCKMRRGIRYQSNSKNSGWDVVGR
jgi:hypothetical protein